MTLKSRYEGLIDYFQKNMPVAESELVFNNPFQLLVAVILSAQCTDKRVNLTTPALFEAYSDAEALSRASFEDVFSIIRSISYPNNKARHLIAMASKLVSDFGAVVPDSIEELMTLPGVGRKTANVVASIVYGEAVIAVDTHIFRVSRRIGLSAGKTPLEVEMDLEKNIDAELHPKAHHWLLLHGRYTCTARNPKCSECGIRDYCKEYLKTK